MTCFSLFLSATTATSQPVTTQLLRDGTIGGPGSPTQTPSPDGTLFEVGEDLGGASGQNLFHSFSTFDVATGDTVRFTANTGSSFRNVITRITGGRSHVDGAIESTIAGADFFLINPEGVVFGRNATIDVPAAFYTSSADFLGFADGGVLETTASTPAALSPVDPVRFGFFDDGAGSIVTRGRLVVGDGQRLGLVGGDLLIDGGIVFALGGEILLSSVASGGEVVFADPGGAPPEQRGVTQRGDVHVVRDAFVSSSGLSPFIRELRAENDVESRLVDVGSREDPADLPAGAIVLYDAILANDTRSIRYYRTRSEAPALGRGAGAIRVQANDLTIQDADIGTVTVGSDAGTIDIDLTGDLRVTKQDSAADSGIFARSGLVETGFVLQLVPGMGIEGCEGAAVACRVVDAAMNLVEFGPLTVDFTGNTGRGGDIRIAAENVHLQDGGRIATTTLSGGAPGNITLDVTGQVSLTGVDPTPPSGPNDIVGSAIVSNHQGEPAGPAGQSGGTIDIEADRLVLTDGSGLFAQTTGNGDAGDILIDVRRLEVHGDSQIDSSTSGQRLPPGSPLKTTGEGGSITVDASEAVLLAGRTGPRDFARLSTFSQARSDGGAGSIRVTTPSLTLRDGAGIAVTTEGEGAGGDVVVNAGAFLAQTDASITASSQATTAPAGDITITTEGSIRLESGSALLANTGIASGGNILLASGDAMLAGDQTQIRADAALLGGSGGRVVIDAPLLVRAATSSISASAPGGPEVQGQVEINSPVVLLDDPPRPPEAKPLDAASLLLSQCAARRGDDRSGSFQISTRPGLPAAHDGPLIAFETIVPLAADDPRDGSAGPAGTQDATLAATIRRGEAAFRGGRLEAAESEFEHAVRLAGDDAAARGDALRGLSQTHLLEGDYAAAVAPLEEALEIARSRGDAPREAAALGQLGNAYAALGELERATRALESSVELARQADDDGMLALSLNHLGNLRSREGSFSVAAKHYREAAEHAVASGDPLRAAQSLSNAAKAALEQGEANEARRLLDRARASAAEADSGAEAVTMRIHLAERHAELARAQPSLRPVLLSLSHRLLLTASAEASALGNERLRSRILGSLGALYDQEGGRDREAMYLTRRASAAAERAQAPMLAARWSRQAARLLWQQGRGEEALTDQRRAVAIVEATRPETRSRYGGPELAFQRAVAPIYLELVDRLLQTSARPKQTKADQQALLREARQTVERWKAAELRDYFRDECAAALAAQARPLEGVGENVAVVYPILLEDRLELLVGTQAGLTRHVVPVSRAEVTRRTQELRRLLVKRTTSRFRRASREVHDWLVAPYRAQLASEGIETLVFVPDRVLRTIPIGALYDGERFVVEDFAVAITPTLQLLAPRRLDPERSRLLLAGLSESVQGFAPLTHVPEELRAIQSRFGGEVLLDEAFRKDRFAEALRERRPGIVHIASHAQFDGRARDSFVLTHDGRLGLDDLTRLVGANRYGDDPIELLLLSACETAAGDDRAALGLAGLAVRAGARSALGSLWQVDDEATSQLISSFYDQLDAPGVSKAEAFARAQRELMQQQRFRHPFYWAGFMVINNWL